jgi:hypothetical protein
MERIEASGMRGSMDLASLANKFPGALEVIKKVGEISLPDAGIDWNPVTLSPNHGGIGYQLASTHDRPGDPVYGRIRNIGRNQIGVEIKNYNSIRSNGHCNDGVIGALEEATRYVAKMDIMEDTTLLPNGESEGMGDPRLSEGDMEGGEEDESQYRLFAKKLIDGSERIILTRSRGSFGKYIVAQMPSGFFVAYSVHYGEAPYVVTDLPLLLEDKKTLRENGDAMRVRRDRRAPKAWTERILKMVS